MEMDDRHNKNTILSQAAASPIFNAEMKQQWESHGFKISMACVATSVLLVYASAITIGIHLWPDDGLPAPADAVQVDRPFTPFNEMSEEQFGLVATFFLWLTVVITGLGAEVVLGELMVLKLVEIEASYGRALWRGAQLSFSLFVAVSVFSASPLGLPFAVLGLCTPKIPSNPERSPLWKKRLCARRVLPLPTQGSSAFPKPSVRFAGRGSMVPACPGFARL